MGVLHKYREKAASFDEGTAPAPSEKVSYSFVDFEALPGWASPLLEEGEEALSNSVHFFQKGAPAKGRGPWHSSKVLKTYQQAFEALEAQRRERIPLKEALVQAFRAYRLGAPCAASSTLFTGYYHPVLKASKVPTQTFRIPLYKRPETLVVIEDLGLFEPTLSGRRLAGTVENQTLRPFWTRRDIRQGALRNQGLEIGWVADLLEAFLMMVQGSGTLDYEDGTSQTFHYDGTNGHPYNSIGQELVTRGIMDPATRSLENIRAWCAQASEAEVEDLLDHNASYVFFRASSQGLRPEGALGTPLVSRQSIAVDPRLIPMGAPLWIEVPPKPGTSFGYQGLGFAQDVGGAIKGPARADLYCGPGQSGEQRAGELCQTGDLYVMIPKGVRPEEVL